MTVFTYGFNVSFELGKYIKQEHRLPLKRKTAEMQHRMPDGRQYVKVLLGVFFGGGSLQTPLSVFVSLEMLCINAIDPFPSVTIRQHV